MLFVVEDTDFKHKGDMQTLYFYSASMPYHQKMLLMLDKVEEKHKAVSFFAIDVEAFQGLCRRFEVKSIPMILLIFHGDEVKRISGLTNTKALIEIFDDICGGEHLTGENNA